MQAERGAKVPHSPMPVLTYDAAKLSYYCSVWKGHYVHANQSRNQFLIHLILELFLFATGMFIKAAYPLLGFGACVTGAVMMIRTINDYGINKMEEAVGCILGGKKNIRKLPKYGVDKKAAIMRIVYNDRTVGVIFNFTVINEKYAAVPKIHKSWVFILCNHVAIREMEINEEMKNVPHYKQMKAYQIKACQGAFLTHLVQNRGVLSRNSQGVSYHMNDPMNWNLFD